MNPESLRKKLLDGYEQAIMSKRLATLDLNTPVDFSREDSRYEKMPLEDVKLILEKYNFKSLLKRIGFGEDADNTKKAYKNVDKKKENPNDLQKGLFDG